MAVHAEDHDIVTYKETRTDQRAPACNSCQAWGTGGLVQRSLQDEWK